MVRGSNPTLNSLRYAEEAVNKTCSYKGISLKTLLLLALTFLSAVTSVMLRGRDGRCMGRGRSILGHR